jgi:hypothetical protein
MCPDKLQPLEESGCSKTVVTENSVSSVHHRFRIMCRECDFIIFSYHHHRFHQSSNLFNTFCLGVRTSTLVGVIV